MKIQDYYDVQGQGEPLVFIHGSFATISTWKKLVERLQDQYLCISIKLPGHGGVPDPDDFDRPTMSIERDIVRAVLQDICGSGDVPIHLVGHSYGGVVALVLSVTRKLNVRSLTLFEPVAGSIFSLVDDKSMQAEMQAFLQRYMAAANSGFADTCSLVIDFWGGVGSFASLPEPVKNAMRKLVRNNLRHWALCSEPQYSLQDLKSFDVPCALVNGSQSNEMAHRICGYLNQFLVKANQFEIAGASHFMVNTHVNNCEKIVLQTLVLSGDDR